MATAQKKSGKGDKADKDSKAVKAQKADAEVESQPANGEAKPGKAGKKSGGKDAKSRIKYESTMPRDEAVAYFEAIVAGLRKGAIEFKRGEETLAISPADHVEVEVKASRKRDRETVSFEITWRREGDADLTISAS